MLIQVVLYISKTVFATKRGDGAQHKLNNFHSVAVTVNITDMYMHWSFLNFAEQRVGLRLCVWDSTLMLNWNQLCYSADVDSRTKARGQGQGHKKIRGQGQPFRGQTLSRPRTGMLEAKAKDQGHKRKCSQKKKRSSKNLFRRSPKQKSLQKFFQAFSDIKHLPNDFLADLQTLNNSKNSAVLTPRTGQFSRTWGLEAKAKGLTFEARAKAKDFKMCPLGRPRGQRHPRGLHLCYSADLHLFARNRYVAWKWISSGSI